MHVLHSGLKPTKSDRRDYDFLRTKKLLGAAGLQRLADSMPEGYFTDSGLWMPDQNEGSNLFDPPCPPMPMGCTNFTQADLCADEDSKLYNPAILEAITHANANGGTDLRTSLKAVTKAIPGHPAFFNVQAAGKIDFFDAVRLAMLSTSTERRGVSVGSPYWTGFGAIGKDGIYPTPDFDIRYASWHNWAVKGWKKIQNTSYLICKMWCGPNYGDKGFGYMTRDIFNATMNVRGSVAFTIDKLMPGEKVETVGLAPFVKNIVSYVQELWHL